MSEINGNDTLSELLKKVAVPGASVADTILDLIRQLVCVVGSQTPQMYLTICAFRCAHKEDKPMVATSLLATLFQRLQVVHKVQRLRLDILLDIVLADELQLILLHRVETKRIVRVWRELLAHIVEATHCCQAEGEVSGAELGYSCGSYDCDIRATIKTATILIV